MLTYRGQLFNSAPLAPTPLQGVKPDNSITVVYWRHAIDGVYDPGLRVKLCTVKRCAEIEGGGGVGRHWLFVVCQPPASFVLPIS
ncbi:flagellar protein FlhE [Candidatus Symbiopectobacterium endolongispinus]